jgi:hypothetical protein
MIRKEADWPRPRAFKYYEFFNSLTPESTAGWRQIDVLREARRGDIIAWRFPTAEEDRNTGHVLFVADTPSADELGILTVRVYDAAAEPHSNDTRGNGENGVGSGFIKFEFSEEGRPTAFWFAPAWDQYTTLPIVIGRLEPGRLEPSVAEARASSQGETPTARQVTGQLAQVARRRQR